MSRPILIADSLLQVRCTGCGGVTLRSHFSQHLRGCRKRCHIPSKGRPAEISVPASADQVEASELEAGEIRQKFQVRFQVMLKHAWRALLPSYQKKDWRAGPSQSSFDVTPTWHYKICSLNFGRCITIWIFRLHCFLPGVCQWNCNARFVGWCSFFSAR